MNHPCPSGRFHRTTYFQNGGDNVGFTNQMESEELRSQVSAMAAQIRSLQAEVKRLKIVEETLRSLLK
jgi:hypothetical protein